MRTSTCRGAARFHLRGVTPTWEGLAATGSDMLFLDHIKDVETDIARASLANSAITPRHSTAIVMTARNEGISLPEWLAHNRARLAAWPARTLRILHELLKLFARFPERPEFAHRSDCTGPSNGFDRLREVTADRIAPSPRRRGRDGTRDTAADVVPDGWLDSLVAIHALPCGL